VDLITLKRQIEKDLKNINRIMSSDSKEKREEAKVILDEELQKIEEQISITKSKLI
jgi:hypothetical protein